MDKSLFPRYDIPIFDGTLQEFANELRYFSFKSQQTAADYCRINRSLISRYESPDEVRRLVPDSGYLACLARAALEKQLSEGVQQQDIEAFKADLLKEINAAYREIRGLKTSRRQAPELFSWAELEKFANDYLKERMGEEPTKENPYRGLAVFREQDALFFFGRERFVHQLIEAVQNQPLTAVIGPSGSGKSSVVFAGLIAQLRKQGSTWVIVTFRPRNDPFQALAGSLVPILEPGISQAEWVIESTELAKQLAIGNQSLSTIVPLILEKNSEATRLLLVADQFEELYTLCSDSQTRQRFLDILLQETAVLPHPPITMTTFHFVFTLRADFLEQVLTYRSLADALQGTDLKLGPMTREELGQAIRIPAEKQGVIFEPGLIERILDDVGHEPGNLPLLEFALTMLWERQDSHKLTHTSYEAIGRVAGALAHYADEIYTRLRQVEQEQARRVFIQLVRPGERTEDTRRLVVKSELDEKDWGLVQRLADKRLLVTNQDSSGQPTVEVVHEALIRGWGRLREWMAVDRTFRAWQERLRIALQQWTTNDRDEGALLRGTLLAEAEGWLAERVTYLNQAEREFIQDSMALREKKVQEREAQRRLELETAQKIAKAEEQRAREAEARRQVEAQRAEEAEAREREQARAADKLRKQVKISLARQLAAQAQVFNQSNHFDLALLLSLQATYLSNVPEVRGGLLTVLQSTPHLIRFFYGHSDKITSVVLSPDGKTLASGSEDKTIIFWDLTTGKPIGAPLIAHTDHVSHIVFSPDGHTLASSSCNGLIILWDVVSKQPLYQLHTNDSVRVGCIDFSPDGQILASSRADKIIILWDVRTGKQIGQPLTGHLDEVNSVAFSPNGKILASGSLDNSIILWDVSNGLSFGQPLGQPLKVHTHEVLSLAFNPDGKMLASGSQDKRIIFWDVETGHPIGEPLTGHDHDIASLTFSPDGQLLASGSKDRTISLWDVQTHQPIGQPFTGHLNSVSAVVFSQDGQMLISCSHDQRVILWRVHAKPRLGRLLIGHTNVVGGVNFSLDGQILVSRSNDKTILWDVTTGKPIGERLNHTGQISSIAFSPDGQILASGDNEGNITLWNRMTGQSISQPLRKHVDEVQGLAFSPDGKILASSSTDQTILLWDLSMMQLITSPLIGHTNGVESVAFSPDGKTLASASWDHTVILWDVSTGKPKASPLIEHTSWVHNVAFSPDGRILASGGADNRIILWEVATGQMIGQPLTGHGDEVNSVTFNSDGQLLASSDRDNKIILWDVATGRQIGPLVGHSDWVWGVSFGSVPHVRV